MAEFDHQFTRLVQAIHVAMDPFTPSSERVAANSFIEQVKSNSSVNERGREEAIKLAVALLTYSQPPITNSTNNTEQLTLLSKVVNVNNFGLQLLELIVKFNWNSMPVEGKRQLQVLAENVILRKDLPLSVITQIYNNRLLKDQFSRFAVELLKRLWPQDWNGFLPVCLEQKQNEIVLYIVLRLSEDIGIFFLPANPQRRREINGELKNHLPQIYQYIADSLAFDNIPLTLLALQCLSTFFEWCPISVEAITFLCKSLSIELADTDALFRVCSAVIDALLTVLERKSYKPEEKKTLLVFFEKDNFMLLVSFLEKLIPFVQHKISNQVLDEKTFDLVKKLCHVFSAMGQNILSICSNNVPLPETFPMYLEVMIKLMQHENQIYNHYAVQFWKDLMRNPNIREKCLNETAIISLVQTIPVKIVKQTQTGNIFLVYEFDGIDDYDVFFYKLKAEYTEFLRQMTRYNEVICMRQMLTLMEQIIPKKPFSCNEWEMLSCFSDAVCNNLKNPENFASQTLPILDFLLTLENQVDNPKLESTILSCISSLSTFIAQSQNANLLKNILNKIFSSLILKYEAAASSLQVNKEVKSLRRHACALFIKLGKNYTKMMIPLFPLLKQHINSISDQQETDITQLEKCLLYEGLLTISNEFSDYLQQKDFINEILSSIQWLLTYNMEVGDFITNNGLTSSISQWSIYASNRAMLVYAVNIVSAILRRVKRKEVMLPEMLPYVCSMTKLISNLNEMWKPSLQAMCHEESRAIIFAPLMDSDRILLIENPFGVTSQVDVDVNEPKQLAMRMQTFFWMLHENCYNSIGLATSSLNPEMYENMDFTTALMHMEHVPLFKLKTIMRTFFKSIVANCHKNVRLYELRILPLVQKLLPFLFQRINSGWETVNAKRFAVTQEEGVERMDEELLEEQICRVVSREFVEVLSAILLERPHPKKDTGETGTKKTEEFECLSQLGQFILERVPEIVPIAFTTITWLDSTISLRGTSISTILIQKIISANFSLPVSDCGYLFNQIMVALGYFGEHEQNQAMLLSLFTFLYEGLFQRAEFSDIRSKLVQFCGGNIRNWMQFEEKVLRSNDPSDQVQKKRRDNVKKLLGDIIGKNLCELYRKNREEIKNLRPMFARKKEVDIFNDSLEINVLFEGF